MTKPRAQPPSRQGRKAMAAHFDPQIAQRVRILAVEEDTTVQALLEEAVELLLKHRSRPLRARAG